MADGGERFLVDAADVFEVLVAAGAGDDQGADAFFDGDGDGAAADFPERPQEHASRPGGFG
ncbi:hypothetical protein [Streptomyces sp. NPDC059455]|uniref:hypothetical protein n=1 Tax=Streptomyces sp. NPDC059455 TaxID=3346837 RepID=UPI0036758A0E